VAGPAARASLICKQRPPKVSATFGMFEPFATAVLKDVVAECSLSLLLSASKQ
jgi:hypothetical protein